MNKISLLNFRYKFILTTKWNIESVRLRVPSLALHLYYVIHLPLSNITSVKPYYINKCLIN